MRCVIESMSMQHHIAVAVCNQKSVVIHTYIDVYSVHSPYAVHLCHMHAIKRSQSGFNCLNYPSSHDSNNDITATQWSKACLFLVCLFVLPHCGLHLLLLLLVPTEVPETNTAVSCIVAQSTLDFSAKRQAQVVGIMQQLHTRSMHGREHL